MREERTETRGTIRTLKTLKTLRLLTSAVDRHGQSDRQVMSRTSVSRSTYLSNRYCWMRLGLDGRDVLMVVPLATHLAHALYGIPRLEPAGVSNKSVSDESQGSVCMDARSIQGAWLDQGLASTDTHNS